MAIEQYFDEGIVRSDFNGVEGASLEKQTISFPADGSENNSPGDFDCNICLDSVQDPVVTLCGHIYCWPCIYKWIHFQSVSTEKQQSQCPVCKAEVSQKTLVPLYGRGQTANPSEGKAPNLGVVVPQRPKPACGINYSSTNDPHQVHSIHPPHQHGASNWAQSYHPHSVHSFGGVTTTDAVHPIVGMFGEMIYSSIFGLPETTLYPSRNSYHLAGSNSPRVRRHLKKADQSLGRVWFFLLCCMVLCLFLF